MSIATATTRGRSALLCREAAFHLHRRRPMPNAKLCPGSSSSNSSSSSSSSSSKQTLSFATTKIAPLPFEHSSSSRSAWSSLLQPGACVLLTTIFLYSSSPTGEPTPVGTGWWPWRNSSSSTSSFDGLVPPRARKQRARAEVEMRAYLEKMRSPVQELIAEMRAGKVTREEFDKRMASFNEEVELSTHRIIFGVTKPPDARRRYEAEHGNCRATPEAIRTVAALSPLVEIGASRGHWQRALSTAGATVVSFDKWVGGANLPAHMAPVGKVFPGDERAIRLHRDKTLLLVYPPPGEMALRCVGEYQGDVLLYVGEGRGGANGCDELFDVLDAEWETVSVLKLDPFPQCFERLFVLRRKPRPSAVLEEAAAESGSGVR